MKIYVINGPNLNFLGVREPDIYGSYTLPRVEEMIKKHCDELGVEVVLYQSNHEGDIVDKIQEAYLEKANGIVINPAAYTHTSIAIPDAIKATSLPTVEIHISDPDKREEFRHISYVRDVAIATVKGKGVSGYLDAIDILVRHPEGEPR
ncbi:MAG: type II 3-dehydroquinate dehydratase [Clostridia bacterium]|nr:type II 3-dehydroquinate dehydratase [Clostridia bacterium]